MEKQERDILEMAMNMFNRYGIKSVTMDDLAREMGVSKKTIYKYFQNKAELVHQGGKMLFERVRDSFLEVRLKTAHAIDELFEIDKVIGQIMENHNPGMRFQLQKYYPETYNYLFEGRKEMLQKIISENIERGKKDGCFRPDAATDIISILYCSKVENMPEDEQEIIDQHSIPYITRQALIYHIRGLATPQGLNLLEEKLKTYAKDED